jgi:hypothetical protein
MREDITQVDLLKIDTEGHEFDVLLGASGMVRTGAIAAVQFEFGETLLGTRYHFKDFWDLLSPYCDHGPYYWPLSSRKIRA